MSGQLKTGVPSLDVGVLHLQVQDATGHEHRLQPIANRAATLFATRFAQQAPGERGRPAGSVRLDSLVAAPLQLELHRMSNEQAAGAIATAWLNAVAQRLRI